MTVVRTGLRLDCRDGRRPPDADERSDARDASDGRILPVGETRSMLSLQRKSPGWGLAVALEAPRSGECGTYEARTHPRGCWADHDGPEEGSGRRHGPCRHPRRGVRAGACSTRTVRPRTPRTARTAEHARTQPRACTRPDAHVAGRRPHRGAAGRRRWARGPRQHRGRNPVRPSARCDAERVRRHAGARLRPGRARTVRHARRRIGAPGGCALPRRAHRTNDDVAAYGGRRHASQTPGARSHPAARRTRAPLARGDARRAVRCARA